MIRWFSVRPYGSVPAALVSLQLREAPVWPVRTGPTKACQNQSTQRRPRRGGFEPGEGRLLARPEARDSALPELPAIA